ncbi:MAG: hypothetical protein GEU81_01950 [Nitriliruptorales bacterium]|nr:hypothetical protein [Nitriliruptorales bacterium]
MAEHPHGPHLQDAEGHVRAVQSDLEYLRRKRLEPRILHFARRGLVSLADLLRAHAFLAAVPPERDGAGPPSLEARIRGLEDSLDALVTGIATATIPVVGEAVPIDDTRRERGDYDPFFVLAKRSYTGALEERLGQLERELGEAHLVLRAFTQALLATGRVTQEQLDARTRQLSSLGYRNGARIVARAWVDEDFKRRLLHEGRPAVRELDIPPGRLGRLGVAENTADVHHVVVCTLCSCYPHDLLGDPPWWYRTDEYKQRIVVDPRGTLREMFGLELPDGVRVKVHDSTSDVRWMVLPTRPSGSEGMTEEQLADLVTSESLVGTAPARSPLERSAEPTSAPGP